MAQHQCCWGVIAAPDQEARQNPCPLLHTIWNFHLIWHHGWVTSSTIPPPPPLLQCKMCSPSICAHSRNICLGCSSGQGGQTSPPCFFWPKTPTLITPPPFFFSSSPSSLWLVFIGLAGAEWPFMLAAVGYGCVCVRESQSHDIASSDVCQTVSTHQWTHQAHSNLDSVPYLPHNHATHHSSQILHTYIHDPLLLSRRYLIVSCISGHISASWKSQGCWIPKGN